MTMHAHFSQWQDYTGAVLFECDTCKARHTFKNSYFARQWAEQHGTGRYETLSGLLTA